MSTVDPAIAAREKAARRPGNVRVVALLLLLLVGGFAAGYGWASLGALTDDATPSVIAMVAVSVGTALTIISSIAWTSTVLRRADLGVALGNAAVFLSAGAGVLLAARSYREPLIPDIVGFGLLGLGLVALMLGWFAAAARRRAAAVQDEMMHSGMLTTATVSDQGWTVFRESSRILTTVTFTFVDTAGVRRWVRKPVLVRAENPLVNGAETRLWYDAAHPGDEKRIVVEAAVESPIRPVR